MPDWRDCVTDPSVIADCTIKWTPSYNFSLGPCGIVINMQTGEVTIPEGLSLTEASRAFWETVQKMSGRPGFW
jgi:hypothetical protein